MNKFEDELAKAQRPLLAFLHALSGGPLQVAEALRSDVNLVLMRQRDRYDESRPFLPWARTLAVLEYKHWISARQRDRHSFSEETMALLAETPAPEEAETPQDRLLELLDEARKELTPEMNFLLTRYYWYNESLSEIGRQLNRTPGSLARSLAYIRGNIRKAIAKQLKRQNR